MTDKNTRKQKFEISEDKLVELMVHAATQNDITSRLDNKIDQNQLALKADIADLKKEQKADIARLDSKIDRVEDTLRSDISRLGNRIDKLDSRIGSLTKWMVGGMITLTCGMIAGFSIMINVMLRLTS